MWHRTGCGDIILDPVTQLPVQESECNRRLEGAHVFVSSAKRDPMGKMWNVQTCQPPACSVCGVVHSAVGQQPEIVTCGVASTVPRAPSSGFVPPPPPGPGPGQHIGRYISIAHVHEDVGHGVGGSSGGWVITICEARVTGRRLESHVYNNMGDCSSKLLILSRSDRFARPFASSDKRQHSSVPGQREAAAATAGGLRIPQIVLAIAQPVRRLGRADRLQHRHKRLW